MVIVIMFLSQIESIYVSKELFDNQADCERANPIARQLYVTSVGTPINSDTTSIQYGCVPEPLVRSKIENILRKHNKSTIEIPVKF